MKTLIEWTAQGVIVAMVVLGVVAPDRWSAGDIALFAMLGLQISRMPDAPWFFRVKS